MKRKKKLVAIVMGILIGTMSCMTAMATSKCSCGYVSDMYTVIDHDYERTTISRPCAHNQIGMDMFVEHVEIREYYCPEDGCEPWIDEIVVNCYWKCFGF